MHTRIEEIRLKLGLTKKDFAKELDITEQAYSNYSKGKRIVPTDVVLKVKQLFGISSDWLLTGDEEKTQNIDYKTEIKNNLDLLNDKQIKYIYHIIEAEKIKY